MSRKTMGLILMMMPLPAQAQIPPPPPLPGQNVLGENLVRSIEAKYLDSYAKLLSDKLVVYDDGKVVAHNKEEWLKAFGEKLVAEGVTFEVSPGFSSTGRLLFIEYFNSTGSWGGSLPAHCCWSYDAVAYDVAEGTVTVIRRLRGGDTKLDERGLPAR